MRIAIVSDTHDNIWSWQAAVPLVQSADVLIHCGDLCSPFMIPRLAEAMQGRPVHLVWGNNDGDRRMILRLAQQAGNVQVHGDYALLTLAGLQVAVQHYPDIARGLAECGRYDLVCYGHDHTAHIEQVQQTVLVNPGELMGLYGRTTLALFDTESRQAELKVVAPR